MGKTQNSLGEKSHATQVAKPWATLMGLTRRLGGRVAGGVRVSSSSFDKFDLRHKHKTLCLRQGPCRMEQCI